MSCGLLLGLLVAIGGFDKIQSGAVVEIKFLKYVADCFDQKGFIWKTACDPIFKFCVDRPSISVHMNPCYYGFEESNEISNTNSIDFSAMSDIKGIPNPWKITDALLKDKEIQINIDVQDVDDIGSETLAHWKELLPIKLFPSKNTAAWTFREMEKDGTMITIKYRMYCPKYYFGEDCSEHRLPKYIQHYQ